MHNARTGQVQSQSVHNSRSASDGRGASVEARAETRQVITANRLRDGRAVYLTAKQTFSESLLEAIALESDGDIAAALSFAETQERIICDPYVMKVRAEAGTLAPISAREHIRATGPEWIRQRFGYRI